MTSPLISNTAFQLGHLFPSQQLRPRARGKMVAMTFIVAAISHLKISYRMQTTILMELIPAPPISADHTMFMSSLKSHTGEECIHLERMSQ